MAAARLNTVQAQAALDPFLREIEQTQNPFQLRALGLGLAVLQVKPDSMQLQAVLDRFLAIMERTQNPQHFNILGQGLAAVAAKLNATQAQAALSRLLNMMRDMSNPPCSLAAQFTRDATLPMIITLLKWPTCSPNDRDLLIKKIGELKGVREAFGTEVRGEFYVSLWRFVEWAEKQGYDVNSDVDRMERNEIQG